MKRIAGRHHLIRAIAVLAVIAAACGTAHAQPYPNRPIRLLVGFAPGGGVDINARLLAARLTEILGQQVLVENRPGAGTNIVNEAVAKAAPDGYMLLFTSPAVAINMSLYKNPPYDALRDFTPVSVFSESTNILVVPATLAAKSIKELVDLARSKPGSLNYSSAGSGTTQHLAGELFNLRTATKSIHVPYKGSAPSITALIAGEVQMSFVNPVAIGQQVKSGRLRALAVAGARRTALMPEIPTMKEAGVDGVEVTLWYGALAPSATPRAVLSTLANGVIAAANTAALRQRLLEQGAEPVGNTLEEFGKQFREDVARWAEVVAVSGARAD
ncbi:MAG: tripartite tricarboxylate transporter substrate binding protein [Betaproteobacteria bacterium]|nr:tripartite tricarboxylate transporter substrate binding protein [Betaproteobacteria bacterium]